MSLYRKILKKAWQIFWQNKYLGFFGIFAAILGNGGEYEIVFKGLNSDNNQEFFPAFKRISETGIFSGKTLTNIFQIMTEDAFSLLLILLISLAILFLIGFFIWLAIVSQAALVNNSAAFILGKKSNFLSGLESGKKNFWPVFGLNILIKIFIYLILTLVSLPIILSLNKTGLVTANFLYLIAFIIFIPLAITFAFIIKYAIAYVVVRSQNFSQALKSGWQLFIKNWLISFEMAVILFFINLAVGLAIILAILILLVPFLFLAFTFYYLASLAGFWTITFFGLICLLVLIVLGGACLAVFQTAAWTGLFLELVKSGAQSKLVRVFDQIYNK